MLRQLLCRLFVAIGKYLFGFVVVWSDEHGDARAIIFADSERDKNVAIRELVDELDSSYETRNTEEPK